jgi:hypothetical protein
LTAATAWAALAGSPAFAEEAPTNTTAIHFQAVDVMVDSPGQSLAAYQLEFAVTNVTAKIVGIEGGEHPAFAEPPFYDPKAMQHERVILAAFSTNAVSQLPAGKTRVATIHLQISGVAQPKYHLKLPVAADANGNKIPATATIEERKAK